MSRDTTIKLFITDVGIGVDMKVKTFGQCGRIECRYNFSGKCADEENYDICLNAVKQVLGEKRYEDFLEFEKEQIERGVK